MASLWDLGGDTWPHNCYRQEHQLDTPQWANIYFLRTFIVVLHNLHIVRRMGGGGGGQPTRWTNLLNWSFVIVKMNGDIDVRKVGCSCHSECWLWWICWNSLLKCCCYSDPPATPTLLIFNKGSSSALHLSFSPSQPHVCRSFPFSSQTCS